MAYSSESSSILLHTVIHQNNPCPLTSFEDGWHANPAVFFEDEQLYSLPSEVVVQAQQAWVARRRCRHDIAPFAGRNLTRIGDRVRSIMTSPFDVDTRRGIVLKYKQHHEDENRIPK